MEVQGAAMTALVVDASVAATWLFRDERNAVGHWVLERLNEGTTLAVPTLWVLEMTNLLASAERSRRITRAAREDALRLLAALPVQLLAPPTLDDLHVLDRLVREQGLTAYDAEYLRVCQAQSLPLATLDRDLLKAARRIGVATPQPGR